MTRARFFFLAVLAALSVACSSDPEPPPRAEANGSFDTEIFLPGSNPPNYGTGAIEVVIDAGEPIWLAQGASAVAIDIEGRPTVDPAFASFFAVQVFQYTSARTIEVFELRVAPEEWLDGNAVPINTVEADALFGVVYLDANGQQTAAEIHLAAIRGDLVLDTAGVLPGDSVQGQLNNVEMIGP